MKNLVLLLSLSCILFSCQKSEDEGVKMLSHLSIENAEKLIPLEFYDAFSKVVFVNETGGEKVLSITVERGQEEKIIEDITYSTDVLTIQLTDESVDENSIDKYSIYIKALAQYWDLETYDEYISVNLYNQTNQPAHIPSLSIGADGQPLILSIFKEELMLHNKTFLDVYSDYYQGPEFPIPAYSAIHYNIEWGIVGYKDYANRLWVFERFE